RIAPVDTKIAPAANKTSILQCFRKNFLQISRPLSDAVSILTNFLPFHPYRRRVLVTCSRAFSSLAINDVSEPLLGPKPAETSLLPESHPASVMVGSPAVPREGLAAYVSTMVALPAVVRPRGR